MLGRLVIGIALVLLTVACDSGDDPGSIELTATQARPSPPATTLSALTVPEGERGTIEGSLSYPASALPPAMMVCAESASTAVFCTAQQISDSAYTYGKGYKLEVPPGRYLVYASVNGLTAYYSEFVTCGMRPSCSSHKPIVVMVDAGGSIKGIDPWDWYAPPP